MCTVLVGCIVGSSVEVWQEMHPEDLRSASSWNWPRNGAASCRAPADKFELARRAKKKDNAETQRTLRLRTEDLPGFWRETISARLKTQTSRNRKARTVSGPCKCP